MFIAKSVHEYVMCRRKTWVDKEKDGETNNSGMVSTLLLMMMVMMMMMFQITQNCRKFKGFNLSTPNDPYSGRTAPLTSKLCILYIYSTNIGTEYFKHGIYSPFFFSSKCSLFHNSNVFGSLLFTFYIFIQQI